MKKRLTIEDRILIENLLKLNYKLKDISNIIECESSTISREIKKRRITGKDIYKECEKKGFHLFVMDVLIKLIVERKSIIIITLKHKKTIITYLSIHELV